MCLLLYFVFDVIITFMCRDLHRRIGFSLQSYMPNNITQVVGRNIWTHVRGQKRQDEDGILLDRPKFNMDPTTVAQRKIANENLSNILYKGANEKRNY